jgi:hypothetical protein
LKVLADLGITKHEETMGSFLKDSRYLNPVSRKRILELQEQGLLNIDI